MAAIVGAGCMARSKHTRPARVLAASRIRAPYEPRGSGDTSSLYGIARLLKELGMVPAPVPGCGACDSGADREPVPLPRLRLQRPGPGYLHPATRADITALLSFFDAPCIYGLRSIALVHGESAPYGRLQIARLVVPGRIFLYAQPNPPWLLRGRLTHIDEERLHRAGANVERIGGAGHTIVSWPGQTLRDYLLFDGLMHEIGHHLIQQYRGKRTVRLARTKDHEAFADHFAYQCRLLHREAQPG